MSHPYLYLTFLSCTRVATTPAATLAGRDHDPPAVLLNRPWIQLDAELPEGIRLAVPPCGAAGNGVLERADHLAAGGG